MQPYKRLEREWAELHEVHPDHCVAVSSGSAALHVAFEALLIDWTYNLECNAVIVPDFTMIACPRAVALTSCLHPVFADCNDRLVMNAGTISAVWQDENCPAGIMPVHIYGRRCSLKKLRINRDKTFVVEDCAEAHGLPLSGRADAYCWSFYRNKIVAGEEGGAVIFKDLFHAEQARMLKNLGSSPENNYVHMPRGMNYRMSDCHASLILNSLSWLKHNLETRREIESWYNELVPQEWHQPERDVPWVYDLRLPKWSIDDIVKKLNTLEVPARCSFKPMSMQKEFLQIDSNETARVASKQVLYLPILPGITRSTVASWVEKLEAAVD